MARRPWWRGALAAVAVAAAPAAGTAQNAPHLVPLPDSSGWGVHILALARGNDSSIWVGTYGDGIFVLRPGATAWEHLTSDTTPGSISSDFVHAFAFAPDGDIWYGTVGGGWGLSRDGGHTWRNWAYRELGPQWLYVAPNGLVLRGDTLYVGTADGIRVTADHGESWSSVPTTGTHGLPGPYVLALAPARDHGLWVSTLKGFGQWAPGVPFAPLDPSPVPALGPRIRAIFVVSGPKAVVPLILGGETCPGGLRPKRREVDAAWQCVGVLMRGAPPEGRAVRELAACEEVMCAGATSAGAIVSEVLGLALYSPGGTARSLDVYAVLPPPSDAAGDTLYGTACGFLRAQPAACLTHGDTAGVRPPAPLLHSIFARPIALSDQPFIDQTYRYGSTMGGTFQQHQGVEFNDPPGTTVHAIGSGTVVYAGPAEREALTVAIRHDSTVTVDGQPMYLFSTYYHNSRLLVTVGQQVARGQPIARVGNTGRAINAHLHLEIHVAPTMSAAPIVNPAERYPPFTTNPELWIEPLPGTGVVAGVALDGEGRPVPQARVYGLVKPEPQETPFSYAETYGDRAHPDPIYGEQFAVGDVPPGEYDLGVTIDSVKVFRHVRVEAGKYTWVEFRPQ
jgi:hypothetical protein